MYDSSAAVCVDHQQRDAVPHLTVGGRKVGPRRVEVRRQPLLFIMGCVTLLQRLGCTLTL